MLTAVKDAHQTYVVNKYDIKEATASGTTSDGYKINIPDIKQDTPLPPLKFKNIEQV